MTAVSDLTKTRKVTGAKRRHNLRPWPNGPMPAVQASVPPPGETRYQAERRKPRFPLLRYATCGNRQLDRNGPLPALLRVLISAMAHNNQRQHTVGPRMC